MDINYKLLRESKNMTQGHLAQAAGLSIKTIIRLEQGLSVSAETIMAVKSVLNINDKVNVTSTPTPTPVISDSLTSDNKNQENKKSFLIQTINIIKRFLLQKTPFYVLIVVVPIIFALYGTIAGIFIPVSLPSKNALIETIKNSSEISFTIAARDLIVRLNVIAKMDPIPDFPDIIIYKNQLLPFQPLPWPDNLIRDLPQQEQERAKSTSWPMIGMLSPDDSKLRINDAFKKWIKYTNYKVSISPMPKNGPNGITVMFSPITVNACLFFLEANQNFEPNRVFVQVQPTQRGNQDQSIIDSTLYKFSDFKKICQGDFVNIRVSIFSQERII